MHVLITGGAGFIGSNASNYYLQRNHKVTILDNLSRVGGNSNIEWLINYAKNKPTVLKADIRSDIELLKREVSKADLILHLAGQVAVTSSVADPREDFESNILGTFNILEAMRLSNSKPVLIYSSTNKVYGGLEGIQVREEKTRYKFITLPFGVNENQPLDFHSPYGCSKGAADQYVRDYARIYNLKTIVFRQSCIYGPRQFGIEDQGWLAWFIIAILKRKPITIYGNGKQVRDILYVDDLIDAYDKAFKNIEKTKGQVYNIGGGNMNTLSVWGELKPMLESLFRRKLSARFSDNRPGDQLIYISDTRKALKDFNWRPKTSIDKGINNLYNWIASSNKI